MRLVNPAPWESPAPRGMGGFTLPTEWTLGDVASLALIVMVVMNLWRRR